MIEPVKNKNTVDIAIEHIGDYIAKNMKEGDVLPSERDLAEQLQISRNITREALQHFRTLGIIESKPKVGAVIARLLPADVYANYKPFLAIMPHTFQDLAHLRLTLELGCAEKAVENVTEKDLKELALLSEKIRSLAKSPKSRDKSRLNEMDMEFHTKIMKLSGNTLIDSLIPLVVEFFEKQFQDKPLCRRDCGYQEHFEMVNALKERDIDQLSLLIRSHITSYIKNYKKQE